MLESESKASWNSILAKDVALCKSPLVLIYLWKELRRNYSYDASQLLRSAAVIFYVY